MYLCHGLGGRGTGHSKEQQGRSEQQFHGWAGDVYPCEEHNNWWVLYWNFVSWTGARRRFPMRVALAGLLVLGAASSEAQPSRSSRSWCCNRSTAATWSLDHFTGNFRVDLDQRAGTPVNVVQVVVGPTGFVGAPEQAVVDYIRSIFADRPQAGPHRDGRRPRGGLRAQASAAALPRHAAPVRFRRPAISSRRAAWRERDRRRGRQRFSSPRR